MTEKVHELKEEVDIQRHQALEVISKESAEDTQSCLKPSDCPCLDLCYPHLPNYSIFDIPRLSKKKKLELLNQGIIDINDVPITYKLNDKQRCVVDVAQSNHEVIDHDAISKEFQRFEYPLYFLDYETYLSAIPKFDGYKPQQQIVFQYSLHKIESVDGEITHTEHLAITKDDPSISLVKQLREDIGDEGTVFVWFKPFEMTRNKELAIIHPEYADFLENLNERIYDLGDFINYGFYVHPDFKGSWSIKKVLSVMVPELSYKDIEINKGDQAMIAWWDIVCGKFSCDEAEQIKQALLKYCELDTWAMVKIFQKLKSLI